MEGAGVSKGNKRENERNKNELADNSYDMLTRGQSVPKPFHSHSFRIIQKVSQLFSFFYVEYVRSMPERKRPGSFPQRSLAMQTWAALFGNVKFAVKGDL